MGKKKFNSIFINQLIHFFFSTPLSAHIECSLFSFDAVEKKNFGHTAEQAIWDNPELEAIIDYCAKRAAFYPNLFLLASLCVLYSFLFSFLCWV